MITDPALKELSDIVGPQNLTIQHDDLINYASDATKLEYMPHAVAFPGNSEEISRIFLLANREHFPVIPRGAGSGMSGGALPVRGGLVLAMDRLNRILIIDQDNLIAKVEPGVITAHFMREVEKLDLFYPPDPASIEISTIGGNVAECAGGLRAVKYGVTRDYVLGLEVVLPTDEIISTGVETTKGVAGYDLTRLIVGSEGWSSWTGCVLNVCGMKWPSPFLLKRVPCSSLKWTAKTVLLPGTPKRLRRYVNGQAPSIFNPPRGGRRRKGYGRPEEMHLPLSSN
jgi:glycolate oxidase